MFMPAKAMRHTELMSRLRPGLARYPAELIFFHDISIVKATTATVGEVC